MKAIESSAPRARVQVVLASLWIALLALSLGGCKSSGDKNADWQGSEVSAPSDRVLWEVSVYALEKEGFPTGAGLDPATQVATTPWRNSLAPFKGEGYREQAQVKFTRVAPGRFRVDVRVKRQTNEDLVRPMDLTYAKWEDAADNKDRAQVLLQRIKSRMGTDLESTGAPKDPLAKKPQPAKPPPFRSSARPGGG
jgi:hypothetical protein